MLIIHLGAILIEDVFEDPVKYVRKEATVIQATLYTDKAIAVNMKKVCDEREIEASIHRVRYSVEKGLELL